MLTTNRANNLYYWLLCFDTGCSHLLTSRSDSWLALMLAVMLMFPWSHSPSSGIAGWFEAVLENWLSQKHRQPTTPRKQCSASYQPKKPAVDLKTSCRKGERENVFLSKLGRFRFSLTASWPTSQTPPLWCVQVLLGNCDTELSGKKDIRTYIYWKN